MTLFDIIILILVVFNTLVFLGAIGILVEVRDELKKIRENTEDPTLEWEAPEDERTVDERVEYG